MTRLLTSDEKAKILHNLGTEWLMSCVTAFEGIFVGMYATGKQGRTSPVALVYHSWSKKLLEIPICKLTRVHLNDVHERYCKLEELTVAEAKLIKKMGLRTKASTSPQDCKTIRKVYENLELSKSTAFTDATIKLDLWYTKLDSRKPSAFTNPILAQLQKVQAAERKRNAEVARMQAEESHPPKRQRSSQSSGASSGHGTPS